MKVSDVPIPPELSRSWMPYRQSSWKYETQPEAFLHLSDVLQTCGEALNRVRLSLNTVGIYLAMGLDSTHTKLVREYSCAETFEVKGSDLGLHFGVPTKTTFVVAKLSWFLLYATREERCVSWGQSGHRRDQAVMTCK